MGRQIVYLRTSERTQYKRCRWAWYQSYVETLKPKTEAPALRFGTLIHKALEARYPPGRKRGPHPTKVFKKVYDAELKKQAKLGFRDADGNWADARDLGVSMLDEFVRQHGDDERYEVVASEQTFQILLKRTKTTDYMYVGTIDGVWRDLKTRQLLFTDWKTCKSISTNHLVLDEQAGAYWTFGTDWARSQKLIKPDEIPTGILYTFMRKAMPDPRPRDKAGLCLNKDGTISKVQPAPLFHREFAYRGEQERENFRARVTDEIREMEMARKGKLGIHKTPGQFTCSMCGFRDMCELHESGDDWEAFRDSEMVQWEPYAAHEIAAGELK